MRRTKLFRVASMLMLAVGVLGLITSGSQLLYLTEVSIGYTAPDAIVYTDSGASVTFAVLVALAGAGLRLAAGIVGLRKSESRGKFIACLVLCLLVFAVTLVVKIVDWIVMFNLSALIGVLISLIIPALYLIGLLKSRV